LFHSTKRHQARNLGDADRVVLLIDLEPPSTTTNAIQVADATEEGIPNKVSGRAMDNHKEPMPRWLRDQIESQAQQTGPPRVSIENTEYDALIIATK
jgi:hypothetical protein